ncbi:hypothetical protein GGS23DRAFT_546690 [Durotheca rogersii]|uniref:uncharacterized protein n=1 Tax=Durotheca rogersii TaxID=419775 RepID=UPI00221F5F0C|nr:uncharacterized protein GGS23DRAFT_546690 [Durotheca rogersii]KAI5868665.1 hypothetical protein GGS23DRAFT_546690 [Durotheca rogersii]
MRRLFEEAADFFWRTHSGYTLFSTARNWKSGVLVDVADIVHVGDCGWRPNGYGSGWATRGRCAPGLPTGSGIGLTCAGITPRLESRCSPVMYVGRAGKLWFQARACSLVKTSTPLPAPAPSSSGRGPLSSGRPPKV